MKMRVCCLTPAVETHQDGVAERSSLARYSPSWALQLLAIKIEVRDPMSFSRCFFGKVKMQSIRIEIRLEAFRIVTTHPLLALEDGTLELSGHQQATEVEFK
jgi:hypothetical protein